MVPRWSHTWSLPLRRLLAVLLAVAVLFSAQRLLFFLLNAGSFPDAPWTAFAGGLRFDLSAIGWLYAPWVLLVLLAPEERPRWLRVLARSLFHLSNAVCFFLNCVDLEYYKFTLKRSTADLFNIATSGGDLGALVPVFVRDYWYVALAFMASLWLADLAYRRAHRSGPAVEVRPWWPWRVVALVIVALAGRGGLQYMPLAVLDASSYAPPAYAPLVLNSPFTVMTSIGKPVLRRMDLMPPEQADRIWPVHHRYGDTAWVPPATNVVVIVLESFGAAYSARLNPGGTGYMPFLDSLMGEGICCTRAYANGRRSIDGIPAILAAMPKMMEEAFTTSPYSDAPITALAGVLAAEGYVTSFYHGGRNGTMGFDAFAAHAGFQRYVGRNEYPDDADDDGVWGIRDRPFLRFHARQMAVEREPFMSAVFTLSSHHPYHLPGEEAARFKGGTQPIHATLRYTDDALREYFATVRGMPWYARTLFVITADHTADLERNGQLAGSAYDHWIPLLYYMPGRIPRRMHEQVTQQIDILPTVLDMLGHDAPFFSFGSSVLRPERLPAAISEASALWMVVTDSVQLRSDGYQARWYAPLQEGAQAPTPTAVEGGHVLLQAAIQQYTAHLLARDMVVPTP